jgi:hypothetical protein
MNVILNTISIDIVDLIWFEWLECSVETEHLDILWTVNDLHVVVKSSFGLDHLIIRIAVGEIINTVNGIGIHLHKSLWSLSEWGSPVMGWFWGIIEIVVTSKFTIDCVVDIINVGSINIFFDLI